MYKRHIFDANEMLMAVRQIIRPYVGVACDVADLTDFVSGCLHLKFYGVVETQKTPTRMLLDMGAPSDATYKAIEQVCHMLDNIVHNTVISQYEPEKHDFKITIDHYNTMTVHVHDKVVVDDQLYRLKQEARIALENGQYDDPIFQRKFMEQFKNLSGLT